MTASPRFRRAAARVAFAVVALGLTVLTPPRASGQSYRGWATTTVHAIELRPIGVDTVPRSEVVTDVNGRLLYKGIEVTCVADLCTGYLPLDPEWTVAAMQDLNLTYWGLGVEGLSMTAMARVRVHGGSDLIWPRTNREFDAMLAYAQLQRGPVRVRAGRQEVHSGLGFSAFDGLGASYVYRSARAELYGGRSLARGLRQPANDALRPLDDFFIDQGVLLVGGSLGIRTWGILATARYHREILRDRSGLVSERASLDASTVLDRIQLRGSVDYDFSFQQVGKAEVTASAPLAGGRWLAELSGRRYVPYFDLSTIWGFFEPVSYSEIVARIAWSPSATVGAWVSGGARKYGETGTTVVFEPMRDNGWRADAGARWEPGAGWALSGRYQLEWGPGGFLSSADGSVRYRVTDDFGASLSVLMFQQIEEYRLGEGRAIGMGATADYQVTNRIAVMGGLSLIRHRDGGNVFTSPWDQGRAWTSLRLDVGGDPGLVDGAGRR